MNRELCGECRFDSAEYTIADAHGSLRALGARWRWLTEGVGHETLRARPAAATWSALEYAAHSRDVLGVLGWAFSQILVEDRPKWPAMHPTDASPVDPPFDADIGALIAAVGASAHRLAAASAAATPAQLARQGTIGDAAVSAHSLLFRAVHDAQHHLQDVGRGLKALGAGAPAATGAVVAVNTSKGGVPKKSTAARVVIGLRGVQGDRQAARQHHGRVWQAVCLWSKEVIDALAAEGHPIAIGSAGENITVEGINWRTVRPGVRLRIGTALVEVSAYSTPCSKNAQWFIGRDFARIDHDRHPGWSRAYASVLLDGDVAVGDPVVVEP